MAVFGCFAYIYAFYLGCRQNAFWSVMLYSGLLVALGFIYTAIFERKPKVDAPIGDTTIRDAGWAILGTAAFWAMMTIGLVIPYLLGRGVGSFFK